MNEHSGLRYVEALKKASAKITDLLAENDALRQRAAIAVVGLGCRFPGGEGPEQFWSLLAEQGDAIREVPPDRWEAARFYDADPDAVGKMYTRSGGFVADVAGFDPGFFGITPREAEAMDPQQRFLLEVSWEALDDAALGRRHNAGIFVGMSGYDYFQAHIHSGDAARITGHSGSGVMASTAAGRLSYFHDFHGPCVTVDTACSSSLVALHLAIQSLRRGEIELALAGGISLMLSPDSMIALCKVKALAADGRCRAFDAMADGYGRGEGVGVLALKRLADAERDGDRILAVLAGSAVNHDGRSNGLTAPNGLAQQAVIQEALRDAGLSPDAVDYVEAHGTGTSLGDPIEVNALQQVFGRPAARPLLLGSVKTNIGHAEAAAGIAGVIKVILALRHQMIPASLHFSKPNPHIDWAAGSVQVTATPTAWPDRGKPRIAGVSAFGLSGTNAHLIVMAPAPTSDAVSGTAGPEVAAVEDPVHILPLSAATPEALHQVRRRYDAFLAAAGGAALADICHTAASRQPLRYRHAVLGATREAMRAALTAPDSSRPKAGTVPGKGIVFLFSGQGSHAVGMARDLYRTYPAFREAIDRCSRQAGTVLGRPLTEWLYGSAGTEEALRRTEVAQPVLFAVQYALAALWQSWGITPAAVIGHSVGEYAAACVAGVVSLEVGMRLVCERGRRMQALPPDGAMAAVFAPESTVRAALEGIAGPLGLAAINGPGAVTISGSEQAVTAALARLGRDRIEGKQLAVSHAFHSPLMAPMVEGFEAVLAEVEFAPSTRPFYSTVTGDVLPGRQPLAPAYWTRQILQPVQFLGALRSAARDGYGVFLEIGPGDTLAGLARPTLGADRLVLSSLRKGVPAWPAIAATVAELYGAGIDIAWPGFNEPYRRRKVGLPSYPFQHQRYWLEVAPLRPGAGEASSARASTNGPSIPEVPRLPAVPGSSSVSRARTETMERPQEVADELVGILAEIGGFDTAAVDRSQHLTDMGLDSVMLLKLGQAVERRYGLEVRMSQLFQELDTLDNLAAYVAQHAAWTEPAPTVPAAPPPTVAHAGPAEPVSFELPAHLPADPSAVAPLLQSQLQLMAQVAAQNLNSVHELARQQMAWLGRSPGMAASPAHIAAPAKAPALRTSTSKTTVAAIRNINLAGSGSLTAQQSEFVSGLVSRHVARTRTSKQLTQQSRAVLADWKHSLSFWGQLKEAKYPIISCRSEGPLFWDVDGNEYIDIAMGMGVHFFGHKPAAIHAALARQMEQGMELGTQTALTGQAARLIHELTGCERVAFSNTGSEVVMVALRLARAATGRDRIVIFKNSYHGIFDGVLAVEEDGGIVPVGVGTPPGMVKDVTILEYGSQEALDAIAALGDSLAAVLVEPVQSRHPDLQPQGFLAGLRRVTRDHGIALIFDEMINGFRIHPGGAQAWFGIQADIVLYGKIVGGGLPIGVIAGKARYLDYIDGGTWQYGDRSGPQSGMIYFGGTFCRNPATMATAHAALSFMKERGAALQEEVTARTSAFCDALNFWFERELVPLRAQHFSSQWRLVPVGDPGSQPIELELLYLLMLEHGVYTWERRINFFSVAHGETEVARVLEVVKSGVRQIRAAGFAFSLDDYPDPQFGIPSSPQRRLYALSQRPGGQLPYHLPQAFWIDGPLDCDRLEDSFRTIIQRHESLRTGFVEVDGELVSSVVAEPRFSIERLRSDEPGAEAIARDFLRPFDMARAPLLRVAVVSVSDTRHLLLADAHHIAVDGVSFNRIAAELMALYQGTPLPAVECDLRQCLRLQAEAGEDEQGQRDAAFWREKLAGDLPLLRLPADFPRPVEPDFEGDNVVLTLDAPVTRRLKELSKAAGASLYIVLLAAYEVLLHRLTGQDDILVGGAVSGRRRAELANAVGMFVNTVVFRDRPSSRLPFRRFLDEVRRNCLAVYDHQDYPFELMATLDSTRPPGRNPLFDTMLSYENAGERAFRIADLRFTRRDIHPPAAMFDLNLDVIEENEVLTMRFCYATALFRRDTVVRWAGYFERIVAGILDDPDRPLGRIDILGTAELEQIAAWNDTAAAYPADSTLIDLFEAQAAATPDRTAVVSGDSVLTYGQLASRVHRLARRLRAAHGLQPGDFVAIHLERSASVIVTLLGIQKAGGAYVPLDVDYPADLLDTIITDSGCRVVITTAALSGRLPPSGQAVAVDLADLDPPSESAVAAAAEPERPPGLSKPDDIAYVIYTSGSTGRPKGCLVTHRNVVRLMRNDRHDFDFGADDVWLTAHSFCFDFSVWEIYGALLNGGRLVIASREAIRDPAVMLDLIRRHRVTVLNQTPAAFQGLIEAECARPFHELSEHLRIVIFGGDRLEPADLRRWIAHYPLDRIALINMYGITETTVHVTYYRLSADDVEGAPGRSLIGRPLPETTVHVCNQDLGLQPLGVAGELYVGGSGVCAGYLNRPELTGERFPTVPLGAGVLAGQRLYRSGDLGRLLPDGRLEYLGRNDDQVQVRGHRVETGAIVQHLLRHPDVEKALVVDREAAAGSGARELVAYVIGGSDLTAAALRQHLALSLPEYMIPALFARLAALPLTSNGKIDRKALPPPESVRLAAGSDYVAPCDAIETTIARVWAEVLDLPLVGIEDNYFALGGDSIKALQIVSRLHRAQIKVALGAIFTAKTIAALRPLVSATGDTPGGSLGVPGRTAGAGPLSAIQHWFLAEHTHDRNHFNNAVLLRAAERLDADVLQRAVNALWTHHDGLRLRLSGQAAQEVAPAALLVIEVVDLRGQPSPAQSVAAHAGSLQRGFDLYAGPLFRCVLYRLEDADRVLLLGHHLVVDGISWRILLEDFADAYDQGLTSQTIRLPAASDSYLTWAVVQRTYARSPELLAEAGYWAAMESEPIAPLPHDFDDPRRGAGETRQTGFTLGAAETRTLLTEANRTFGGEINDLLLTALAQAFRAQFGATRIRVQLEGHGREEIAPERDFTRTVGWFTAAYPVVLDLGDEAQSRAAVRRVQEQLRRIPRKGVGYGILKYLTPPEQRAAITFGPAPEIGFNYLGQFDSRPHPLFSLLDEPTGPALGERLERHQTIDVEMMVIGGRLAVTVSYNHRLYSRETIAGLAMQLEIALRDLIAWGAHGPEGDADPRGNRNAVPAEAASGAAPCESGLGSVPQLLGVADSEVEFVVPLSPMQEGLLFHALSAEGRAYFEQFTYRLQGDLDLACFEASWHDLALRHEILRAAVVTPPGRRPCLVGLRQRSIEFGHQDLRRGSSGRSADAVAAFRAADRERGFDPAHDPLMRVAVLQCGDHEFEVVWSHHHVILDGWSLGILQQELMAIYSARRAGRNPALPEAPSYRRYLDWLAARDNEAARAYWSQLLAESPPPSSVPGVDVSGRSRGYEMTEHRLVLDAETTRALNDRAARLEVTLNSVIQAIWALLLATYNGRPDVIFGAVVSGRPPELADVERMVGLFLQTIPVRIAVERDHDFATLARAVQRQAIASEPHQHLSLAELQRLSGVRETLFDHVVVFENYPLSAEGPDRDLRADDLRAFEQMHYDFSIVVHPGTTTEIKFTFNRHVVVPEQIGRIAGHFEAAVSGLLRGLDGPLRDLDIRSDAERHGSTPEVAQTTATTDAGTVLDLFEAQVRRTPDSVAIEAGGQAISYRGLNARANALASLLREYGIGRDQMVGIFLGNGIDYVASIIAVQKAAGIFVPFDIEQPRQRLQMLVGKLRPQVIVTTIAAMPAVRAALAGSDAVRRVIAWTDAGELRLPAEAGLEPVAAVGYGAENALGGPAPADGAYVLFTSGSTGEPKAICSSHEALRHFIDWERRELGVDSAIRCGNLALMTFDVSLRDIFLPLGVGGTICVPDRDIRMDGVRLLHWLADSRVTLMHIVPTLFRLLIKELEQQGDDRLALPALRTILFAGESLFFRDIERARQCLRPGIELLNLYGPSETTLAKCFHRITGPIADTGRPVPIGGPITGVRVLILKDNRPVPAGAIGEIHIQPPFRCLGYFGDPALTAERFIRDPSQAADGDAGGDFALYRTGDLGRLLPNGTIEFCGRIDGQVKVSGVRIELAEIERAAMASPEIDQAVGMAYRRADGDNALACYYTQKRPLEPSVLRARLGEVLPSSMIPAYLVPVASFAMSLNGKVDRRALPKPEELIADRVRYEPPANETETRLAAIWAEILGLKRVGVASPFFEVGGDSLRAIRVISRINHEFNSAITIGLFFERPTIRQLAESLLAGARPKAASIPALPAAPDYAVSHAQRRLWILDQLWDSKAAYNLSAAYSLTGPLDAAALQSAFAALVRRHEVLRTTFVLRGTEVRQRIHPDAQFEVGIVDLRNEKDPEAAARALAQRDAEAPFDLAHGPLLRVRLLALAPEHHVLVVAIHHIISDAASVAVMIDELLVLYGAATAGRGDPLLPLRIHYKDYAAWENARVAGPAADDDRAYWRSQLAGPLEPLDLPTDRPRPVMPRFRGGRVTRVLDPELAAALRRFARAGHGTLFMVLVAAVKVLLHRISGQSEIIVGSPIASRDHEDLQTQLGFYVNTLALRDRIGAEDGFASLFAKVKATIAGALEHRGYPFDLLVEDLGIPRDLGRPPIFDVVVALQDGVQRRLELGGIIVEDFHDHRSISKYSLGFEFFETANGGLTLGLEYDGDLFDRVRVEGLYDLFVQLAGHAVGNPARPLAEFDAIPEVERRSSSAEVLAAMGCGPVVARPPATVPDLVAEQARLRADAPAIITADDDDGERVITFGELHKSAQRIAGALAARGVKRGDTVGVVADRGADTLLAMLGIMRAGAAYVPIDVEYPPARIAAMAAAAGCRLMLSESPGRPDAIAIADLVRKRARPGRRPAPDDVAYVIFTSGSTGVPKGVQIEHRGFVNASLGLIETYGLGAGDRVLQFASPSFDASLVNISMAWFAGAAVVTACRAVIGNTERLRAYIRRTGTTVATLPPTYLVAMGPAPLEGLRVLVTAGEAAPVEALCAQAAAGLRAFNAYGPTETSVCATVHPVDASDAGRSRLPIGRPLPNLNVRVVDAGLQPVPPGATGEIVVGGVGLARGYLGDAARTAERFVTGPDGQRLYRTGDLGRWLDDGSLDFLGRIDDQVKINGHRIEPAEVARSVRAVPGVRDAHVGTVPRAGGESALAAWYVPEHRVEVFPSVAEFYVYDERLYGLMAADDVRSQRYAAAFARELPGKTVLEIGPGPTAVLSRMAIEAGAKKVYAVELLDQPYRQACETVERLGLGDRIRVLHGDAATIELPERVDVCISEIVGSIGGAEGAARIINGARRLLHDGRCMLPQRSLTLMAGVSLPEDMIAPGFDGPAADYVEAIFRDSGRPFDLRLCLRHLPREAIATDSAPFEDLNFTAPLVSDSAHAITLTATRAAVLTGFVLWLRLFVDADNVIDTLESSGSWLPVYVPAFPGGVAVDAGDRIEATITRTLCENGRTPDFGITGRVCRSGEAALPFSASSRHYGDGFRANPFHARLFADVTVPRRPDLADSIRAHLAATLPPFAVPTRLIAVDAIPTTISGKVDRAALPVPAEVAAAPRAPQTEAETMLLAIWCGVLGSNGFGVDDDFFAVGGDSIKAIQIVSRLHRAGWKAEIRDVLKHPTVARLAMRLRPLHSTEWNGGGRPPATGANSPAQLETGNQAGLSAKELEDLFADE